MILCVVVIHVQAFLNCSINTFEGNPHIGHPHCNGGGGGMPMAWARSEVTEVDDAVGCYA